MQAFVRLPTDFEYLLLNAAGNFDVSPNVSCENVKKTVLAHSLLIQCTPDIVATFIVAVQIKWPFFLVQNTVILLY